VLDRALSRIGVELGCARAMSSRAKNWFPTQGRLARLNNFLAGLDNSVMWMAVTNVMVITKWCFFLKANFR
jgi:hypothetical protein